MNRTQVLHLPADRIDGDLVAALFFEDERPPLGTAALLDWRLNGLLTTLLLRGQALGKAGEQLLVRNNGKLAADWALFMGGGRREGLGPEAVAGLVRHFLQTCRDAGFERVTLCLDSLPGTAKSDLEKMAEELASADERPLDFRLSIFESEAGAGR